MVAHPNFYESLSEAQMRLRNTFVLYDGVPYSVFVITDHKSDGIFRIYLEPVGLGESKMVLYSGNPPPSPHNYPPDHPKLGDDLDKWLDANPNSGILRKHINSPLFNKFRPFPLGMCNSEGALFYAERAPNRRTEQGLTTSMLNWKRLRIEGAGANGATVHPQKTSYVDVYGPAFKDCIMGIYPSPQGCLYNLLDPKVKSDGAAFHRQFALIRGPVGTLFFAYKTDIVGVLPYNNFQTLRLAREFQHTREVIELLNLFQSINVVA